MAVACLLPLLTAPPTMRAQETDWETGSRLQRVLAEEDRLSLRDQSLRDGLATLEQVYRVCIFLDRRVDPNRRMSVSSPAISLRDRVALIAESAELETALLEWGIYVGPPDTAQRLATLTALQQQRVRGFDRNLQRRLMAERPLKWPRLAQPQPIVESLAQAYQIRLQGIDEIPFDVWAERSLPEMDFPSALTLLLAGFNSTFEWLEVGQSAAVVPFPSKVSLQEVYRLPVGRQPPLAQWRQQYDGATFVAKVRELQVDGPISAHRAVKDWISGRPTRTTSRTNGEKRLTLKIGSATLKQATDYLAKELKIEFEFSGEAEKKLGERIALEVTDASLEELLRELLDPLELTFKIDGSKVQVSAKP